MSKREDRRDRFEWNPGAAQPNVVLDTRTRLLEAARDLPDHLRFAAACLRRLPRALLEHRRLTAQRFRTADRRTIGQLLGMGVSAVGGSVRRVVEELGELPIRHALVRLPYRSGPTAPWSEEEDEAQRRLLDELLERGYEVLVAIPQDRAAVTDVDTWRRGLESILDRYRGPRTAFQVGQAINRRKWGLWTVGEYVQLLEPAFAMRDRHPEIDLVGPPVLDAEFHYHLAVLGALARRNGSASRLDRFTSQLYVDRQGPPDRPRGGWELVGKCTAMAAIAAAAGYEADDVWITETNWPLRDQGEFAPARGAVEVDEEAYADYMVRYLLLALGSGLVGRVYWWQLVARGYGLIEESDDPAGAWRRRPAHTALSTALRELDGLVFVERASHPELTVLRFRDPSGAGVDVVWRSEAISQAGSEPAGASVAMPVPADATEVLDRRGRGITGPATLAVGPSPIYLRFSARTAASAPRDRPAPTTSS